MKTLSLTLLIFLFASCKEKSGGYDFTGKVYIHNSNGTYDSFELGTYILTLTLLYAAYFLGKISNKTRNDISGDESFRGFISVLFISIYVILLPFLFLMKSIL